MVHFLFSVDVQLSHLDQFLDQSGVKLIYKTSVDESEKSVNKDWWKIMYVVIKENKYSRSIKKSMSANSSSKNR